MISLLLTFIIVAVASFAAGWLIRGTAPCLNCELCRYCHHCGHQVQ